MESPGQRGEAGAMTNTTQDHEQAYELKGTGEVQRADAMRGADVRTPGTVLVTSGTGKTGHRVFERLVRRGVRVRSGSRTGEVPFDWADATTWGPALHGVD